MVMNFIFYSKINFITLKGSRAQQACGQLYEFFYRLIINMSKPRGQNFTNGFTHEKNINDLFQTLYNESQIRSNDKKQFTDFIHMFAKKNEDKNISVDTANKFVIDKFSNLWKKYQTNNDKPASSVQESYSQPDTIRRRKPKEGYIAPRENPVFIDTQDVGYTYLEPTPARVNHKKRQEPYNYDSTLISNGIEPADTSVGSLDMANRKPDKIDDNVFIGQPLTGPRGFKETGNMSLGTDSSNNPLDQNVSFDADRHTDRIVQEYVIALDSRLRDILISPNSNSYRMSLTQLLGKEFGYVRELRNGISNIISIELLQATIPNIIRDSTLQFYEPYVYLDIGEIQGNVRTTIDNPSKVFAQLYYINSDTIRDTPHLTLTPANAVKTYQHNNPLNTLSNITITFYNFDGEVFDFGNDAPKIASVTPGVTTTFQTVDPHGVGTSDRVYIRGLQTGVTVFDKELNRAKGWIIAVNSLNTFEIQYDTTGMPVPAAFGNILIAKLQNNVTLRIRSYSNDIS